MNKDTRKGLALIAVGFAIGVGYILYLLREMNSGVPQIRVSYYLVCIALLVITVGTMQIFLGADKTKEIMSFNTANLSKRDLLVFAVIVVAMIAMIVAMTIFLGGHGYVSF